MAAPLLVFFKERSKRAAKKKLPASAPTLSMKAQMKVSSLPYFLPNLDNRDARF